MITPLCSPRHQGPYGSMRQRANGLTVYLHAVRENSMGAFTLLEVLVAIVILSIGLSGVAAFTGSIMNYNREANNVMSATTLAQDKLEELKNTSYSNVASSCDTDSIFTRTWNVTSDFPAVNMKTIAVTVSWNWKSKTRNVVLKTIVAK